jgi:alkanesulfonate monooxygenase SsuD/methylene tetrahydromethanopterin reductase-like flavin-dependent oxidoreductase (luciferase family)
MPEIGFYQPGMGWSYDQLREFWVEADNLGFDSGWMMDNVTYRHLYKEDEKVPVFEVWTVLPALAEATSNIKMGPMVTPVNRRHPALFAKITSCFDQISNGRLELGMGTGDTPEYHIPWGMPFPKPSIRIETMQEEIQVLKLMWTEKKSNFNGKYYSLNDATMDPKPIQKPHPPIWIGIARGKKTYKVAAEEADGINVYNASERAAKEILDRFEKTCQETGRDFNSVRKSIVFNVVLLENEDDLSYLEKPEGIPPSLPPITGTVEELAKYQFLTLDEQAKKYKEASNLDFEAMEIEIARVNDRFVIGTPETVVEEIKKIADIGFDLLIVQGLDTIKDLRKFATEVMPKVRGK